MAIKIGCWNVRGGLIKHEIAIKELLETENLDILKLTEIWKANNVESKQCGRIPTKT